MDYFDKNWLEKSIKNVLSGTDGIKQKSLEDIVEFIGWKPDSYQGTLLGFAVEREIKMMEGNPRKTGESFSQHSIVTAREVSKTDKSRTTDLTIVCGALFHDDIEELKDYQKNKEVYDTAKKLSNKNSALRAANDIKDHAVAEISKFFEGIAPNIICMSGIDIKSVVEIVDGMTKRPDEYYHNYLERIFGRKKKLLPAYNPLLNVLRMSIIKTGGDRFHNNLSVPRKDPKKDTYGFTIAQRLKDCYKSIQTINQDISFMKMYPEAMYRFPAYFEFLGDCKSNLIEAATNIVSEDLTYLAPEVGADVVQKINHLFVEYGDYNIRKPAKKSMLEKDPKRIFDGTLARYDNWVKKSYSWGFINPQDIRLSDANKQWMKYQLGAESPSLRAKIQEYMDCLMFSGVLNMFHDNPSFRIRGYKKINF